MTKKELRREFLLRRMQLDDASLPEVSASVLKQFNLLGLPEIKFVLSYFPLEERKEFDVRLCEKELRSSDGSIKLCWPKIGQDESSMEAHVLEDERFFVKNRFNILEPLNGQLIEPCEIDLVFVPLLAFDKQGFRVGYGKGFYDRYLARCRPDVLKIGFSFFEAVERISDIDEFDISLSHCITPTRIYEF